MRAIAEFFDVSVICFESGEEAERYSRQLELLAALGNAGMRDLALRSGQLSREHRDVLMGLLEVLEETSNRTK